MKSLSISTATFAVAMSLATSAHANEAATIALPAMDEAALVGAVDEAWAAPADDTFALTADPVVAEIVEPAFMHELDLSGYAFEAPQSGLRIPPVTSEPAPSISTDKVVTTRAIVPHYGDIDAFYGNIVAFYGNINAFWGDINPFYGDINAFWGDISPFYGNISAFWGDIDAFWGDIVAFDNGGMAQLGAFWKSSSAQVVNTEANWSALKYTVSSTGAVTITFDGTPDKIRNSLETLIAQAEAQFGAAYKAKTGKDFRTGFVAEVLSRNGLDLANTTTAKKTLAKTDAQRAKFYLDWHDSLMEYSGIDRVDHWMGQINWTPSITQIQGNGHRTIIGIVDGSFSSSTGTGDNIVWKGGGTSTVGGHGAGVASLIAAPHDGKGVMGIAPEVKIATYNPFDTYSKASWDSVATGIEALIYDAYIGGNETGYVSIINLSLGEKGWAFSQGMADVLKRPRISAYHHETLYVIAAGNEGVTQTGNINWDFSKDASFILVGSVDANNNISSFSNRPGSACLVSGILCVPGNELYRRTVVAPGSLLLVSDGNGGVLRQSGTSFAAPLVSGAVSLLHDRWPWLAKHTPETAEIIFRSAKDLGAPGPDPIYGWGLLDVAASQSPLDFGKVNYKLYSKQGTNWLASNKSATEILLLGIPASWQTAGVNLAGIETVGGTYRDFLIPLSAAQFGQSSNSLGNGYQRMQDFVGDRFARWLLSKGLDKNGDGKLGVNQIQSYDAETRGQWSMRYDAIAPRFGEDEAVRNVHNAATLTTPGGDMSFTLGHGQGALALAGGSYGIVSDHDHATGGVNPVLGFASGEFFAGASYSPSKATTLSVGYSKNREDWRDLVGASEIDQNIQRALGARDAGALTLGIEHKVNDAITVNAQYTHLREDDALLGEQTTVEAFLGEGSATHALTVSASVNMGNGFSFDLSATGGATKTAEGQLLSSRGRVMSTAGQFTLNKRGVVGQRDILRVAVGQPLTIENGELELVNEQVIDRETGELGVVSQTIGLETKRRYTGEIVYATPVSETSELGVVARYVSEGNAGQDESLMIGANFGWRF